MGFRTTAGRGSASASTAPPVSERFEGGTARAGPAGGAARLAPTGYPVGLTIAPIMALPDWRERYGALLAEVARPSTACRTWI